MKVAVYYSSVTGNTKRLAEHVAADLEAQGHVVSCQSAADVVATNAVAGNACASESADVIKKVNVVKDADVYIIAFWCWRSTLDENSRQLVSWLKGHKVLVLGTMGGDVAGDYGRRVENNVRTLIEEENTCLGVMACQGTANLKRIEKRRYLPEDDPHYVGPERWARYLRTQGQPNEEECARAAEFVRSTLQ